MSLRESWRCFLGSDFFFWRKLRVLRAMNRALRRSNHELRQAQQALIKEREAGGQGDYWYQRWRELQARPAYVVSDAELERARTELVRLKAELSVLHQQLARLKGEGTDGASVPDKGRRPPPSLPRYPN